MSLNRTLGLVALGLVCLSLRTVHAAPVTWTIDSTASVISMSIANFSYSGNTVNIAGQNATNGAPLTTWSTTTGNSAFLTGTIATDWANNGTTIQFLGGQSNIATLTSGNYRPNAAAYNSTTSTYENNGAAAADYALTAHTILGNVALMSFNNVTYDIASGPLPISSSVFAASNTSVGGLADVAVQGLNLAIVGQVIPNGISPDSVISNQPNNVNLGVIISPNPIGDPTLRELSFPVNIHLDFTSFGVPGATATFHGTIVATAHVVPEPASITLAGIAGFSLLAVARRRHLLRRDPGSG